MYKKKLLKGCLVATLAIAMAATSLSPVMSNGAAVVQAAGTEKTGTVIMNATFIYDGVSVGGGDFSISEGNHNFTELGQYIQIPEGYKIAESGDFYAKAGEKLQVRVEKVSTDVTMNIQFKCGDEVIAGGDYTVPAGVQNYSVLEKYVPEGYKMTTSGDFSAEKGGKLEVNIEKISTDVTMNIQFKCGDEVVAGGDYTVPAGVQNYSVLQQYVPEGYTMTASGDFYAEDGGKLVVSIKEDGAEEDTEVTMNIQFKAGDEVVAGGDYFVPAGVQNYSVLEKYLPEGYEMTTSGDFMAEEGGKLVVNVEKVATEVAMNIQFKDGDEVVAGGDYFVPAGVQNYSVLEKYVPEGYKMTVSGDFMAEEGGQLIVNIEKDGAEEVTEVTMNIQFKDGDEVVAGGDYFVPAGVQNYSVLEKYVPEGYEMTVSGDFMAEAGGKLVVNIEKVATDVIMNIQFKDGDEVVGGGDYFVPAGVQNYSVLEKYVPEGYEMTVSGDFFAAADAKLVVNVEKISTDVIMNIQFKDGDEVVAGGDYFLPEGVQNYSILEQYVPEGYKLAVSGDFMVTEGGHEEVRIERISTEVIMNIQFKDGDKVIAGGDYFVPAGVQNYSVIAKYVPAGYRMTVSGDFMAEEGGHLDVNVEKINKGTIINVVFTDPQGNNLGGGDYVVDLDGDGIANYSELSLPMGYKLKETGDFFVKEGQSYNVVLLREGAAIIHVVFKSEGGKNLGGGDFFVDEDGDGIANYSELTLPEGYELKETGDFFVDTTKTYEITLNKEIDGTIINVVYVDEEGNNLGGGDYFVDMDDDGIANYSELTLPEGYELIVTGDFFVVPGQSYTIKLQKISQSKIINVTYFDEGGKNLGGGDYFVDEDGDGIANYSELDLPVGYELIETGDFFVENGAHYDITLKLRETILTVTFEDVDGNVIDKVTCEAGVPGSPDETYVFALGEAFQLPEGYQLAEGVDQITDIEIPYGSVGGHTMIVEKIASEEPEDPTPEDPSTEDPTTPEDPAITDDPQSGDDTKADTVKDETKVNDTKADKKNSDDKDGAPQTGDTTSPVIPVAAGGLSLAAIIGVLARKRTK